MSARNYAGLPDVDTNAPDVYETPDLVETITQEKQVQFDSDEETGASRVAARKASENNAEDLDGTSLPDARAAASIFRKAERRRGRFRAVYSTSRSPSPTFDRPRPAASRSVTSTAAAASTSTAQGTISARVNRLQDEIAALEAEMRSSETTPDADHDALLQSLSQMKGKLERFERNQGPGGGGVGDGVGSKTTAALLARLSQQHEIASSTASSSRGAANGSIPNGETSAAAAAVQGFSESEIYQELDRRLNEIEVTVGAANVIIDESSPMPQPLLPHINRLSQLLTLLTQPRHIEAISRRLKLLQTELERYTALQNRARTNNPNFQSDLHQQSQQQQSSSSSASPSQPVPKDLLPVLNRISPILPTLPHLLNRLRTLSTLHTNASAFSTSLTSMEEEQKRTRAGLEELKAAVGAMEKSVQDNGQLVQGNITALASRVDTLEGRLKDLGS